jgi:hypothetical protein
MSRTYVVFLLLIFITQTLSLLLLKSNPTTSVHQLSPPPTIHEISPTTTHESSPTESHEAPNLPLYVGTGYNILTGNPFADKIDPGFQRPIFQITYN